MYINTRTVFIVASLVSYNNITLAMEPVDKPDERTALLRGSAPTMQATPSTAWTEVLFEAAGNNDLKSVQLCLKEGADVNGCNAGNDTALIMACMAQGNTLPLITFLLERKADVTHANEHGFTPLHLAVSRSGFNLAVLELLKNAGANLNAQTLKGYTPCYSAVTWNALYGNTLNGIKWLHNNGADMNSIDKYGGAPIHWAIFGEDTATVHQLLAHGGQLDIKTQPPTIAPERIQLPVATGGTPFHLAAYYDLVAIKKLLLFHALFFDAWNKQPVTVSFLDMLDSPILETRNSARALLQRRAAKLCAILNMQDSAHNTAGTIESNKHVGDASKVYFKPHNMQADLINYLFALEAASTDKLPDTNMFKAAQDAKDEQTPTSCTIC